MSRERVIVYRKWVGEIIEEGPEQSVIQVTDPEAPGYMLRKPLCFLPSDYERVKERKSSGPYLRREYAPRPGAGQKPGRPKVSNEETQDNSPSGEAVDYKARYNELVEEAVSIGLTAKPLSTNFRDEATGAKRCEALEAAIKSQREKIASGEVETTDAAATKSEGETTAEEQPPATQTRKRSKKVAKTAAAKKAAKPAKKAAKTAAAPKADAPKRNGIVAEFGTRPDTNKEKLLLVLASKKNKATPVKELIKALYGGKGDMEQIVALKMVVNGLNDVIKSKRLPYNPIAYEGRGENATITFSTKSGR